MTRAGLLPPLQQVVVVCWCGAQRATLRHNTALWAAGNEGLSVHSTSPLSVRHCARSARTCAAAHAHAPSPHSAPSGALHPPHLTCKHLLALLATCMHACMCPPTKPQAGSSCCARRGPAWASVPYRAQVVLLLLQCWQVSWMDCGKRRVPVQGAAASRLVQPKWRRRLAHADAAASFKERAVALRQWPHLPPAVAATGRHAAAAASEHWGGRQVARSSSSSGCSRLHAPCCEAPAQSARGRTWPRPGHAAPYFHSTCALSQPFTTR